VAAKSISLAGSSFVNRISPLRYLRSVMNGLSLHRRIALGRGARLLDEGEHLTETNGIHGRQQEIQEKRLDVVGERTKADEEGTSRLLFAMRSGTIVCVSRVATKKMAPTRANKLAKLMLASTFSRRRLSIASYECC
jgi:hypothetical protein